MKAYAVLTPPVSKRLIAKGVAAAANVREALTEGRILITLGTTNAHVAEELLGRSIDRGAFAAGFIDDCWNINARLGETGEVFIERGTQLDADPEQILSSLRSGDVLIKGGNAIDPWGVVGVLMGAANGGTVGRYVAAALARGVDIVIPISLSKAVHGSIIDIAGEMGIERTELRMGLPCGMFPLHGRVITEIDALRILYDVDAMHAVSGGLGIGAGSISLVLQGREPAVREAFALIESLREETETELRGRA